MRTQILEIDDYSLKLAKTIINDGGVVGMPTETVYGLGANAFDTQAVDSIFTIKGRPNDNPLIVHVHEDYDVSELVKDIPEYARLLKKAFLPGPLTMVFRSSGKVSPSVSCGLDTVAIRVPSHDGAQRFLKCVGLPIAAPSANLSKHVSPTSAQHVYDDFNGKIRLILDGGKCAGGIESTVLDCTGGVPVILRSGLVTREMIAGVAGDCKEYVYKDGARALSPGMKYKHYSPNCRTMLFNYSDIEKAVKVYDKETNAGVKVFILCDDLIAKNIDKKNILKLGETSSQIAANLYSKLREGESIADLIIAIAPENREGVMVGVMNRLIKACAN